MNYRAISLHSLCLFFILIFSPAFSYAGIWMYFDPTNCIDIYPYTNGNGSWLYSPVPAHRITFSNLPYPAYSCDLNGRPIRSDYSISPPLPPYGYLSPSQNTMSFPFDVLSYSKLVGFFLSIFLLAYGAGAVYRIFMPKYR